MRYLKLYEEHNSIPDNFIRLDSIGHVLDPEEGVMYAMWKKGGYDYENPYKVGDDESIEGLDDKDRQIVDKYFLSCEDITKDRINWDLIQTAKDLSLDYLDEGNQLRIDVVVTENINRAFTYEDILFDVYQETFSHNQDDIKWGKYFSKKINIINSKPLSYRFTIQPQRGRSSQWGLKVWEPEMTIELTEHLIEMFPDEIIMMR